jgi:hypothetical protein
MATARPEPQLLSVKELAPGVRMASSSPSTHSTAHGCWIRTRGGIAPAARYRRSDHRVALTRPVGQHEVKEPTGSGGTRRNSCESA